MTLQEQDLEELRALLTTEKNKLEKSLSQHGQKVDGEWTGTPKGFEGEADSEPEDAADRFEELATNVALEEELERRLKDVDDALARMNAGTYGVDEKTGQPISIDRLRANPAARTNV